MITIVLLSICAFLLLLIAYGIAILNDNLRILLKGISIDVEIIRAIVIGIANRPNSTSLR
jgi:hypothetical protein